MNPATAILAAASILACASAPALAASDCSVPGDVVLSARTPQVDLYDGPTGKRVETMDKDKFPSCLPVAKRAPNMMLEISVDGASLWVPPHMVNYRLGGKKPAICRNLAMGSDNTKVGSTRALGEDCPKPMATP